MDLGKDSVKMDQSIKGIKNRLKAISKPNVDAGGTVIMSSENSDSSLNGYNSNDGFSFGPWTLSVGGAKNDDKTYDLINVMADYDFTGKGLNVHHKKGKGYTTCEVNMTGDNWEPILEEDGNWDCDHPELFDFDVPTVSHSDSEKNKKK